MNAKDKALLNLKSYISLAKLNGMATRPETIDRLRRIAIEHGASIEEVDQAVAQGRAEAEVRG